MKITFDTNKFGNCNDDAFYIFVISFFGSIIGIGLIVNNVSDIIYFPFIGVLILGLSIFTIRLAYRTKMGKLLW